MSKIVIITSLCGSGDIFPDPSVIHNGVDYVAFVDRAHPCETWKQIKALDFTFDKRFKNRRNAKIYKIMPHLFLPEYDYHIWVDSTHDVMVDPFELCNTYLKEHDIAVFKHTKRKCVYSESKEIKRLRFEDGDNLSRQMKFYRSEGYPEQNGLYELPAFIRKNTEKIRQLNLCWWEQICRYSSRDQLSFPYCIDKLGIKINIMPGFANGINSKTGKIGNNDLMPQVRDHVLGRKRKFGLLGHQNKKHSLL